MAKRPFNTHLRTSGIGRAAVESDTIVVCMPSAIGFEAGAITRSNHTNRCSVVHVIATDKQQLPEPSVEMYVRISERHKFPTMLHVCRSARLTQTRKTMPILRYRYE